MDLVGVVTLQGRDGLRVAGFRLLERGLVAGGDVLYLRESHSSGYAEGWGRRRRGPRRPESKVGFNEQKGQGSRASRTSRPAEMAAAPSGGWWGGA